LKIIKTRTGCQYVGHLNDCGNLNWVAQNAMQTAGCRLDVTDLNRPTQNILGTVE